MKTPLILLATTVLLAGCSTNSVIDNDQNQELLPQSQTNSLIQSKDQLMSTLKEIESEMQGVKNIDDCDDFTDKNIKRDCIVNLAFSEAESGNKSLCKNIENIELKSECEQLPINQDK